MNTAKIALFCSVLASSALAQEGDGPKDSITWIDGTKLSGTRVQSFNLKEIKFTGKSGVDTKPAELVASLKREKSREEFKAGYGRSNPTDFVTVAKKLVKTNPEIAQDGYIEAARILLASGKEEEVQEAFTILKELAEVIPTTGYMGEVYRLRIDYYLAGGPDDAKNAVTAADNYEKQATTQAWPDHYVNDAAYYKTMAKSAGGKTGSAALLNELKGLLTKAESTPIVANKVTAQIGHCLVQEKKLDDAKKTFESLIDKAGIDRQTHGLALVGLGHVYLEQGDPTKRDPFRQALLIFLRTWAEAGDSGNELVAEALYFGAEAARKWNEKDSAMMAGRLESMLRNNADYRDTRWGKALAGK